MILYNLKREIEMIKATNVNDAWKFGYTDGWRTVKNTLPSIPPRPGPVPPGEGDEITRYYNAGYALGKYNAGLAN